MQDCSGVSRHPQVQSHDQDSFPFHMRPAIPVDSAPGLTPPKCQLASGHTHWAPMWHSILVSHPLRSREGNILEHGVARIPKNHRSSPKGLSDVLRPSGQSFGGENRRDKTSESRPMRYGGICVGVSHGFHVDVVRAFESWACCCSINPHISPHIPTSPYRHYYRQDSGVIIQGSGR